MIKTTVNLNQQPLQKGSFLHQVDVDKEGILALSWKQPFLSLMLPPYNKIETRSWRTNYRGWVLMCASLQQHKQQHLLTISGPEHTARINEALAGNDAEIHKSRGHALAIGKLIDCRRMVPEDVAKTFVAFDATLWCHIYSNVHAIKPIPWRGQQRWGTITADVLSRIEIL